MFQHNHTIHDHSLLNHLRPEIQRAAFEVTLKEIKTIAAGTVAFIFEKPNGFQMRAGQHIRMTLIDPPASFTLIATLTQPKKSASPWRGETGHIDQSMIKRYVDDLMSPVYYIAGLPEMASAMKTLLTNAGVREENIHAEEFTGFNLNEIHTMGLMHSKKKHSARKTLKG